jgi:hypothetical protein
MITGGMIMFLTDAVENIISRLEINGVPTPKFGKKSDSVTDITSYERIIKWSEDIIKSVKDNLPELSNYIKINELNKFFQISLFIAIIFYHIKDFFSLK